MPKTDAELFVNHLPTVILMLTALMTDSCRFDSDNHTLHWPCNAYFWHGILPVLSTLQLPSTKEGNGWL
jgi:hypothetical protein